jgi:hypothetical protein
MPEQPRHVIEVELADPEWQNLQREADLLSVVFNRPFTPETVAQARVDLGRPVAATAGDR